MKVWVLIEGEWDDAKPVGVYESLEAAQNASGEDQWAAADKSWAAYEYAATGHTIYAFELNAVPAH